MMTCGSSTATHTLPRCRTLGDLPAGRLLESTVFLSRLQRSFNDAAGSSTMLAGACLLERLPVVIPDDPDWETEYRDWQEQLHRRYRKELPKEFAESENAQAEDSVEARWQPAPRVTEADATNDTKSLQRKLDRRLFLLLKGKGGGFGGQWQLPTRLHAKGETMRQTAEHALAEAVSGNAAWKTFFLGNAPCGHWQAPAATTFIHRAQLIKGEVAALLPATGVHDYAWLCREEILDTVDDVAMRELFEKLLPRL